MTKRRPGLRALRYGVAWLGGLGLLLILFTWDLPHELDFCMARQSEEIPFHKTILVVDVPSAAGVAQFRQELGAFLAHVAELKDVPIAVGLDIWFSSELPDDGALGRAIEKLQRRNVRLVGALNIRAENRDGVDAAYPRRHLMSIYDMLDAVGHNWFRYPEDQRLWPFYHPCNPEKIHISAMPVVLSKNSLCESGHAIERRVPLGPPLASTYPRQILQFDVACPEVWRMLNGQCLEEPPSLREMILIVGRFADDPSPYKGRSGPEIVAWATSDLLYSGSGVGARPIADQPWTHLGLALGTALAGLLAFVGLLRYRPSWRITPWRIALAAGILAILFLAAGVQFARLLGQEFSQFTFPILTLILTLVLCLVYYQRRERRPLDVTDREFLAYDVFLSYRHKHSEWVHRSFAPILNELHGPDGRPVRVFLDVERLRAGRDWANDLAQHIHESRILLAVLTPDYFTPNDSGETICRWEMAQALQREASGGFLILPLFHEGYDPVQDTPSDLPHLRAKHGYASDDPNLRAKLKRVIQDLLSGTDAS